MIALAPQQKGIGMAHKEFIKLMKENVMIVDHLANRLKCDFSKISDYSQKHIALLLRLHLGGRALLKDIAQREMVSTPNLCAVFRMLERDGLVSHSVDENDRRNTWYELTESGTTLAMAAFDALGNAIDELTASLSREDEAELSRCMKTMNSILSKLEVKNA